MADTKTKTQSSDAKAKAAARRKKAAAEAKNVATQSAEHVRGQVNGFLDFIRSQGIIGLAVGLAIGAAAGDTVKKLVEGFINPVVQFITGTGSTLATSTWTFEAFGRSATFAWGAALSSLITLLATALVIYWIVNIFKLDKLDKKKS